MIVYTVQPEILYKKMREQGYLEGNKDYVLLPKAYEWMMDQMEKHIANYNKECYPIWLWQRKVNRNERALDSKGKRLVILKLDIPEDQILWSSFDQWHSILNEGPICFDENEWDYFKQKRFPKEEVEKTWERLFDHEWLASRPNEWAGDYEKDWMQGVTPRITMDQIKKVSRFISKG